MNDRKKKSLAWLSKNLDEWPSCAFADALERGDIIQHIPLGIAGYFVNECGKVVAYPNKWDRDYSITEGEWLAEKAPN